MKTEQEIYSIESAYDSQPMGYRVGKEMWQDGERSAVIGKIVEEMINVGEGIIPYYVGYSEDGRRLFEFKKAATNVHYKF